MVSKLTKFQQVKIVNVVVTFLSSSIKRDSESETKPNEDDQELYFFFHEIPCVVAQYLNH